MTAKGTKAKGGNEWGGKARKRQGKAIRRKVKVAVATGKEH